MADVISVLGICFGTLLLLGLIRVCDSLAGADDEMFNVPEATGEGIQ